MPISVQLKINQVIKIINNAGGCQDRMLIAKYKIEPGGLEIPYKHVFYTLKLSISQKLVERFDF